MKNKNELSNEKLGKVTGGGASIVFNSGAVAECPWCYKKVNFVDWQAHVNTNGGCKSRKDGAEKKNFKDYKV